jgi:hypothetical protein
MQQTLGTNDIDLSASYDLNELGRKKALDFNQGYNFVVFCAKRALTSSDHSQKQEEMQQGA